MKEFYIVLVLLAELLLIIRYQGYIGFFVMVLSLIAGLVITLSIRTRQKQIKDIGWGMLFGSLVASVWYLYFAI